MDTHDILETVFDADQKMLSVINIYVEFSFYDVVDENTGLDADLIVFRVPVGLVGDWNTFPSVWVHMSEPLSDDLDYTLGKNMRLQSKDNQLNEMIEDTYLLVQVMVVSVWVVEGSSWNRGDTESAVLEGLLFELLGETLVHLSGTHKLLGVSH